MTIAELNVIQFCRENRMAIVERHLDYGVRPMIEEDIPQVLDIDREAFPTQWPRPDYGSFKRELRNHLARYIVAYKQDEMLPGVPEKRSDYNSSIWDKLAHLFYRQPAGEEDILPTRECIIGMAGFWLMVGEAHVITLATRESYKRCGIGERLLISLIEAAAQLKAKIVTLEVRVSNSRAQALYEKYGFNKEGVRRNYYLDNNEDAFVMTTGEIDSSAFQVHFGQLKAQYEHKWGYSEIH
jgi:ribosomal-protein-alanine N-acetyltransferase